MPRAIQLTVPAHRTERLLTDLRALDPLSLQCHLAASIDPPGDLIAVTVSNDDLREVMRLADGYGLGEPGGVSLTSSEPLSVVTASSARVTREHGRTTWEELEMTMGMASTMTPDKVVVMLIAGAIAGVGIVTGALHVVIGAMVIAPGFQPFARLVLGAINRSPAFRGGAIDILRGYGALIAGSALAAVASATFGASPLDGGKGGTYLLADDLVVYWSTISWGGVVVGLAGGVAGGLLMSINRVVLTAGVMVALALVPTIALVPLALVAGDVDLAVAAFARFAVETGLVAASTTGVFLFKAGSDRRRSTT